LEAALAYSDGSKGGRPPFDPVMMFKVVVIDAANTLSDRRGNATSRPRRQTSRPAGCRKWRNPDAAAYEGRQLRDGLLDKRNTASTVWADTAYRSAANERFMAKNGFTSRVHRKKPANRPMSTATRRANNTKSRIRSRVEHVLAEQKDRIGLFIRTVGIARATVKTDLANLVYNIQRLLFL
jgi:DDE family transposase